MKRWLAPMALLLLGGCAIAPDYRYNGGGDGGYYYGEAPYGGADTVIYRDSGWYGYDDPWRFGGFWGPRRDTYVYYRDDRGGYHRRPPRYHGRHDGHHRDDHRRDDHRRHDGHRPPPVRHYQSPPRSHQRPPARRVSRPHPDTRHTRTPPRGRHDRQR